MRFLQRDLQNKLPVAARQAGQRRTSINLESPQSIATNPGQRSLRHACLCAKIADDYKGKDTLILDLTAITPIVDYFVITTGSSRRQMHAVVEEVDRVLEAEGSSRIGLEGYSGNTWILQDYGDVVLHVFSSEARNIYDLEHLWADAPHIDWRTEIEAETR